MSQFEKCFFNSFYIVCVMVIAVCFDHDKLSVSAVPEIMSDYFWGSHELRTKDKPPPPQTLTCESEILQIICFNKCGEDYICERDRCRCSEDDEPLKVSLRFTVDQLNPYNDNKYVYSKEQEMSNALRTAIKEDQPETTEMEELMPLQQHPALRHHIAHFCPNLKKARECIRTCMKKGLPAFCGKDHVCYCGHRYSAHDMQVKVDPTDVYLQYKDIYEKYFGPRIFDMEASADEEEEKKEEEAE